MVLKNLIIFFLLGIVFYYNSVGGTFNLLLLFNVFKLKVEKQWKFQMQEYLKFNAMIKVQSFLPKPKRNSS
jgi:hypothetical protein